MGVFELRSKGDADQRRAAVSEALRVMAHRGPDGHGVFEDDHGCLGHRRLRIIDLGTGDQPLFNEDGSVALVFNGEIYDYMQLRDELRTRHMLHTRTDSEVLVHRYEDLGPDFADGLNGMYAYALYDRKNGTLHLGIDPLGIKPLYYHWDAVKQRLAFASEIRGLSSILRRYGVPVELNEAGASAYMQLGWCPAPETMLIGVHKLLPGQRATVSRNGMTLRDRPPLPVALRTWDPPGGARVEELEGVLTRAVRRQLVADVPVGLFLSGGVDSSLLAALAVRDYPGLRTFTVGFHGDGTEIQRVNESDFAARVAAILGTKHYETRVDARALLEGMDEGLVAMDEPIADPAILPLLQVARFARGYVPVCLSGDGADEVFGGYLRHRLQTPKRLWNRLPRRAQAGLRHASALLPTRPSRGFMELLRKGRVAFDLVADPEYVSGPFGGPFRSWLGGLQPARPTDGRIYEDTDMAYSEDLDGQLAGQMLAKTDRISMWASIETRVPYLDHEVVAFGRTLPWREKVSGTTEKAALRRLLRKLLPSEIADRPKHGFRVPLSSWFRGPLASSVRERLGDTSAIPEAIINSADRRQLVEDHLLGRAEHSIRIFALLALESWIRGLDQPVPRSS